MINKASHPRISIGIIHSGATEERIRGPGGLVAQDTIDRSALPGRHFPLSSLQMPKNPNENAVSSFNLMYRINDEWHWFPQSITFQHTINPLLWAAQGFETYCMNRL